MTKTVRIENADTDTTAKVRVRIQQLNTVTGKWKLAGQEHNAAYPTSMVTETIHSHRRLIVEEMK